MEEGREGESVGGRSGLLLFCVCMVFSYPTSFFAGGDVRIVVLVSDSLHVSVEASNLIFA